MNKRIRMIRAMENSRRHLRGVHDYKSVDGRTYQTEQEARPLAMRRDVIRNQRHNQQMSANDLYRIEQFLSGENTSQKAFPVPQKERDRIIREYGLVLDPRLQRYMADEESVFEKLCEKWPYARKYIKYKGILYARKYGDAPVTVIQGKDSAGIQVKGEQEI